MMLHPGDVLLYRGSGFWSWAIRVKTWSEVSHVECYVGALAGVPGPFSVASREGIGVGAFPLRTEGLVAVLRPHAFSRALAMCWFQTVQGQGYDWIGLLNFYWARFRGRENRRMFCSEFATRFQRHGGVEPFAPSYDADNVSPGMFLSSPAYTRIAVAGLIDGHLTSAT